MRFPSDPIVRSESDSSEANRAEFSVSTNDRVQAFLGRASTWHPSHPIGRGHNRAVRADGGKAALSGGNVIEGTGGSYFVRRPGREIGRGIDNRLIGRGLSPSQNVHAVAVGNGMKRPQAGEITGTL